LGVESVDGTGITTTAAVLVSATSRKTIEDVIYSMLMLLSGEMKQRMGVRVIVSKNILFKGEYIEPKYGGVRDASRHYRR